MSVDNAITTGLRPSVPVQVSAPVQVKVNELGTAPAQAPALPEKAQIHYDPKESEVRLQEAISKLNELMKSNNRDLAFSRDEGLHTTIITVKNTQTGDVVRQIPNEAALKFAHNLEGLKGLFFNSQS